MSTEVDLMRRALELSRRATHTSPNPRVGAVVAREGQIIGEGFHEGAGSAHAETVALGSVDARAATLFVTLEPCIHEGRTPPCAPAVVAAGIERVVAATADPDPRVAGRGIEYLRSQGVAVDVGLLEREARVMNAPFFHHRITGLPLVTLKLALTLDGRMAAADGSSQWITGAGARHRVHARRAEVDAVLVGSGTVVADDPSLTARDVGATGQPARVVVDASGRLALDARFLAGPGDAIIATTGDVRHEIQTAWKEAGAEVVICDRVAEGVDLSALMTELGRRGFLEIYCEGGGVLASSLLRADLVDRLELFYGGVLVGRGGPGIGDIGVGRLRDAARWVTHSVERLDDDVLIQLHSSSLERILQARGEIV